MLPSQNNATLMTHILFLAVPELQAGCDCQVTPDEFLHWLLVHTRHNLQACLSNMCWLISMDLAFDDQCTRHTGTVCNCHQPCIVHLLMSLHDVYIRPQRGTALSNCQITWSLPRLDLNMMLMYKTDVHECPFAVALYQTSRGEYFDYTLVVVS